MWVESTETDFNDGVFNLTIASGTGAGAQLTLSPFGNAADGNVTISATKNINTDIISSGRVTYADGINYAVTGVWISSITCSAAPNGITTNDEIILINQQGDGTNYGNVGNYEFMRVANITSNFIMFTSSITKIYGATTSNYVLTGQKVTIQRVPNWRDVTISGAAVSLTCTAWDGTKGGMVVFRSTGTVSVGSGASIDVSGKGYRGGGGGTGATPTGGGNGESYDGFNGSGGDVGSSGSLGGGAGSRSSDNIVVQGSAGGTRGGGGGGGCDFNTEADDGAGGGGGGGYGSGGAGGGGGCGWGGATYRAGIGGTAGNTGINAGGGGACGSGAVESNGGDGGNGGSAGVSTGGGANGGSAGSVSVSGGGGGSGGVSYGGGAGGGGGIYGASDLSKIYFGSGGGGGGGSQNGPTNGGAGGDGGGIVIFVSSAIVISGNVRSNGNFGVDTGVNFGGGCGGSGVGGAVYLIGNTLSVGSNLIFSVGSGPTGPGDVAPNRSGGGGGGSGRIRLDYLSLTGTTNPTHYAGIYPSGFGCVGTYKSGVLDCGAKVVVSSIGWTPSSQPAGSNVNVGLRVSSASFSAGSATPDWVSVTNGQTVNLAGRYVQYMSTFTTTSSTTTPRIEDITIAYKVKPWQEKTVTRTGPNAFGFGGGENWTWEVPAKSGQLVTITAYVRYNTSYGTASKPKLTLYNLGISNTATMAQGADTWEQLTVSGTPNRDGVALLKIEGFSTSPGAKMFVDDINISQ
ncbi:MAG: hypothetical protein WC947_04525 [Elusimicrobiota bacterium]